ncbi:MAG: MFS transporter, partial [Planctomycetota bacterium]
YLKRLGLSPSLIALLLGLPLAVMGPLSLPCAYVADRVGKLRMGRIGIVIGGIGYLLFASAGWWDAARGPAAAGVALFAIGSAFYGAGWFGLMSPIVPEAMRGRFWARLRLSWQIVAIVFSALVALLLGRTAPVWAFQATLGLLGVVNLVRLAPYSALPELDPPEPRGPGFGRALVEVLRAPQYASFCCYCFLLLLAVAGAPVLFGLLEKETLDLGDDTVVWLGNTTMAGAIAGFFLIGRAVDRYGTKPVFLGAHLLFAAILIGVLGRSWAPWSPTVTMGVAHLLFGLASAASGVAITTEMMALIPVTNKALGTSLCFSLQQAGHAGSKLVIGGALTLGCLRPHWTFAGAAFGPYDALLLAAGLAVLALTVTLGLVPSVIGRPDYRGFAGT